MACTGLVALPRRAASHSWAGPEADRWAEATVQAGKRMLSRLKFEASSRSTAVSLDTPTRGIQRHVRCRLLSCVHGLGGDQSW